MKRLLVNLAFIPFVGIAVWLWSRDLGIVGAAVMVTILLVISDRAYQWGSSRARENEKNLEELIARKKAPRGETGE